MPCSTPLGYRAEKMSIKENLMRKGINADKRENFEKLFFCENMNTPLTREAAEKLEIPLEMVRWAPSAVNKQPWRVIVCGDVVHFYLKRSRGFMYDDKLDMQMIDIGIALCHFELSSKEEGLNVEMVIEDPKIPSAVDMEYVASYKVM